MNDEELEAELMDEVKDDLDREFERRFKGAYDDEDFDQDDRETEEHRRMIDEYEKDFLMMNDNDKLRSIAQKTEELFRKAKDFDDKIIELNKKYNFLDKGLKYEEERLTAGKIP